MLTTAQLEMRRHGLGSSDVADLATGSGDVAFALRRGIAHVFAQLHDDALQRSEPPPLVGERVVEIRDGLLLMGAAHFEVFETRFKLVHRVAGS